MGQEFVAPEGVETADSLRPQLFAAAIEDLVAGEQLDEPLFLDHGDSLRVLGRVAVVQPYHTVRPHMEGSSSDGAAEESGSVPSESEAHPVISDEMGIVPYTLARLTRHFYESARSSEEAYELTHAVLDLDPALLGWESRATVVKAFARAVVGTEHPEHRLATYHALQDATASPEDTAPDMVRRLTRRINLRMRDRILGVNAQPGWWYSDEADDRMRELYEAGLFDPAAFWESRALAAPGVAEVVADMIESGEWTPSGGIAAEKQLAKDGAQQLVAQILDYIHFDPHRSERARTNMGKVKSGLSRFAEYPSPAPKEGAKRRAPDDSVLPLKALLREANVVTAARNRQLPDDEPHLALLPIHDDDTLDLLASGEALRRILSVSADSREHAQHNRAYGVLLDEMLRPLFQAGDASRITTIAELCDTNPAMTNEIIQKFGEILRQPQKFRKGLYREIVDRFGVSE